MAEPMPLADKVFYVVSGAFGIVFGTGLWAVFIEHDLPTGSALTGLGVIGMGASLLERPRKSTSETSRDRNYAIVNIVLAVCVVGVVGYDIYHRLNAQHIDEGWKGPRNRVVQWVDFFPSWPLDLEHHLMAIKQPCVLKISAVQEQMYFRKVLAQMATEQSSQKTEKTACTIVADEADENPKLRGLETEPSPPTTGVAIRWNPDTQPEGEKIAEWFENLGFIVHRESTLPTQHEPTEIWIDIGPGFLWQQK